MTTSRHIGGSVLLSSEPRILQPIETPFGILQVLALPELDTYALFLRKMGDSGVEMVSLLATHSNGYSCHELATRMVRGAEAKVRAQVAYILDCGGTARHIDHIVNVMGLSP